MTANVSKVEAMEPQCDYFNHDADIGIIGWGDNVETALVNAAYAAFALMTDISQIKPRHYITITFEESNVEFALVRWINNLLPEARAHNLALCQFQLTRFNNYWSGKAWGEPWRDDIERGTEVKGATLTELKVIQLPTQKWQAQCVVDV